MSPAEQEQRVICEVLQGYGYAVEIGKHKAWWTHPTPRFVWWQPGEHVYGPDLRLNGPVCDTPEEAVAWVLANVPRPAASTEAP